jgi:beta-glucosidase
MFSLHKVSWVISFIIGTLALTAWVPFFNKSQPTPPSDIESRIDSIMAKMELVDKVGEMTQLAIDMISKGQPYNLAKPHQLVDEKMREVLIEYRVGSILNAGGIPFSLEHWREVIMVIQDMATQEKPTGIPVIYGIDAVHGANFTQNATLFPQQIGLAATWNPALAYECGQITAYESRASYIPWCFSPSADLGRDQRWPRLWEGFGEDVFLTSQMTEAMIKGFEGDDLANPYQTASCLKHFVGYSVSRTGKDRTPAYIPERQMKAYHLPPFQKGIDAGTASIMINSGEVNGIPGHINEALLTDVLRREMGFEGIAVSDWGDIELLVSRHRVAKDLKEAIKLSVNAGMDMAMVPLSLEFPRLLKELVEEGEVPMSRIDEAVRRILRVKIELGLFENPYPVGVDYSKFASEEHRLAAQRSAEESITLLKNEDNLLPLAPSTKVLVTGPTSSTLAPLNGGWTNTWQGNDPQYDTPGKLPILDAIRAKVGEAQISFSAGTTFDQAVDIPAAVEAAKAADVIVACVGELTYTETVGSIDEMALPIVQLELIQALAQTNKPIVLVITGGRPRIVREMIPLVKGAFMLYYPGNEGGPAFANILYGDVNPSGRLPYTYPQHSNSLWNYDIKGTELVHTDFSMNGFRPQFEFGYGLSYTDFEYGALRLSSNTLTDEKPITISIEVKNTGKRTGKEVVQLYTRDIVASITPSMKRLRGFEKITLEPGQSKTIHFTITAEDLAFVGLQNRWITEEGAFKAMIGKQEVDFVYVKS